jgi:hypothetical protein
MAESSLSLGWTELKQEVGDFLGYGRGSSPSWSTAKEATIERIVQSGVRNVYYPPALVTRPDEHKILGYEWSWLRPFTTLSLVADTGDYDMDDNFGRLYGEFHFAADQHRRSIAIVSVADLLDMRSSSDTTGAPIYAATRYKSSDGSTGQRQEALFYPTPDTAYTLSYQYEAYSGQLSDSYPYPLGGMHYSELYVESCLSVAELRMNGEIGVHHTQYEALLVDAVLRDRKHGAKQFGQMGHQDRVSGVFRRANSTVYYNGNPI